MSKTKHVLNEQLVVILESNWQQWHKVISIYGEYEGLSAEDQLELQWRDGRTAYEYLNSEGWLTDEDTMILEVFSDLSELEEDYQSQDFTNE